MFNFFPLFWRPLAAVRKKLKGLAAKGLLHPPLIMDHRAVVQLFHAPAGGREANDANNAVREAAIIDLINGGRPDHAYDLLRAELQLWLAGKRAELGLPPEVTASAVRRGGRSYNWDFDLILGAVTLKVEFKYGAISVASLPEFFNPAANKNFHQGESYARYFYEHTLPQVCAIYDVPLTMSVDDYLARVHGTSTAPALFGSLYEAEKTGTAAQKAYKKELVDESIAAWLHLVKDKTDLAAITTAFQTSQTGKQFLLCSNGKFFSDRIEPEELVVTAVRGVRLGKYLELQSSRPNTGFSLLLRWKNHAGILYPAWQISMWRY